MYNGRLSIGEGRDSSQLPEALATEAGCIEESCNIQVVAGSRLPFQANRHDGGWGVPETDVELWQESLQAWLLQRFSTNDPEYRERKGRSLELSVRTIVIMKMLLIITIITDEHEIMLIMVVVLIMMIMIIVTRMVIMKCKLMIKR